MAGKETVETPATALTDVGDHKQGVKPSRILVVDASGDYLEKLKDCYDNVNMPLEPTTSGERSREEQAELESERFDDNNGRPTIARKGELKIDERAEKEMVKESNITRLQFRHSAGNPFRQCELEFLHTDNPATVEARIRAGGIDAVVAGLSTYGSGSPEFYGFEIAKVLKKQDFKGPIAITASQSADSGTLQAEAKRVGAIGLFEKSDNSLFQALHAAVNTTRGQSR